jgi:Trypsin-co-occurring domain 2
MDDVSIGEVISTISDQLLSSEANRIAAGRPAIFLVDSVDVEISFTVNTATTKAGGLDLRVVKGDVSREYNKEQVQRATIHLKCADNSSGRDDSDSSRELMPIRPRRRF